MATHKGRVVKHSQFYSNVSNLEQCDEESTISNDETISVKSHDKPFRTVLQNARLMLNRAKSEVKSQWSSISSNLNRAIVKTRRCSFKKGLSSNGNVEENGIAEDNSFIDGRSLSRLSKDGAKSCLKQPNTFFSNSSKTLSNKNKRHTTFAPLSRKSSTLNHRTSFKGNASITGDNSEVSVLDNNHNNSEDLDVSGDDFGYADDDPGIMSESETSATRNALGRSKTARILKQHHHPSPKLSSATSTNDIRREDAKSIGLAFLHFDGETKRILLPDEIGSIHDVKQLFAKAFRGSLTTAYLQSPFVKIYIQDPARQDVYYELDDLSEIKDRTVLKLHEQQPRPTSPVPVDTFCRIVDQPAASDPPSAFQPLDGSENHRMSNYGTVGKPDSVEARYASRQQYQRSSDFDERKFSENGSHSNVHSERSPRSLVAGHGERIRYSSAEPPAKPYRCFASSKSSIGQYGRRRSRSPPTSATLHNSGSESRIEAYAPASLHDRNYLGPIDAHPPALYHNGNSERSNSVSRCGSVTPVIDEEARLRMMNMETQLASLSSLVHSALMAKNVSDTVYKDIDMLRREILGNHCSSNGIRDDTSDNGSVSRFSDRMSENSQSFKLGRYFNSPASKVDYQQIFRPNQETITSKTLSPDAQFQLKILKKRISELNGDFRHLKRTVQLNTQAANDVVKDAFDRIKLILNTNKQLHIFAGPGQSQKIADGPLFSDRTWVNQEQDRFRNIMKKIEQDLCDFEKRIEILRQKVVSGEKRLRLTEIEELADTLTTIGRTTANLKTEFPSLQQRLKYVMASEMDKVVREEKFLKDEPMRLDSALQKCKKLANTMLTMKKLAIVQDRPTQNHYPTDRDRPSSATPQSPQNSEQIYCPKSVEAPPLPPPPKNYQANDPLLASVSRPSRAESDTRLYSTRSFNQTSTNSSGGALLLDSLLDELQTVSSATTINAQERRRVDFAERFKSAASGDSDGRKESAAAPCTDVAKPTTVSNSIASGAPNDLHNCGTRYGSESPNPLNRPHGVTSNIAFAQKRCQSTTPLSESAAMAPPPPPRSSSRTMLNGTSNQTFSAKPIAVSSYSTAEIGEFKRQLSGSDCSSKYQSGDLINSNNCGLLMSDNNNNRIQQMTIQKPASACNTVVNTIFNGPGASSIERNSVDPNKRMQVKNLAPDSENFSNNGFKGNNATPLYPKDFNQSHMTSKDKMTKTAYENSITHGMQNLVNNSDSHWI